MLSYEISGSFNLRFQVKRQKLETDSVHTACSTVQPPYADWKGYTRAVHPKQCLLRREDAEGQGIVVGSEVEAVEHHEVVLEVVEVGCSHNIRDTSSFEAGCPAWRISSSQNLHWRGA